MEEAKQGSIHFKICDSITNNSTIDLVLVIVYRLCTYIVWLFPIIKICWPSRLNKASFIDKLTPSEVENFVETIDNPSANITEGVSIKKKKELLAKQLTKSEIIEADLYLGTETDRVRLYSRDQVDDDQLVQR